MSHNWTQMKIRLPPELHKWFKKRAKGNYRPLSSEFVRILVKVKEEDEKKEQNENAKA